jgi:hypothetical protein
MITCSWRWLLAPDLGQLYDWTRPSTFIGPVTLVCWDNGSQSSLGRLGPGRAPNVERVTRHAGSQHPALRRILPRPPAEGIGISTAEVPEKQVIEHAPEPAEEPEKRPPGHVRETVVIIVLSITAVLTAWCGFESSKWSGEMSIAFSQASSARIEAARQQGVANAARQADLTIWGVYVQARAQRDTALAAYVERRFTDHFRVAYQAWLAQREPTTGPFKMKEYVPPGTTEAVAADQRADGRFADALRFNQRADNYTILTVLFALVLFFAAASTRLGHPRAQWTLLGAAITFLVAAMVILATFPIDF